MQKLAFFAYPDNRRLIAEAIEGAVELAQSSPVVLKPWKAMQIIGFKLDDQVRSNVATAAVLAADITYPNTNVFYEMGYAIGIGKPVIPTVHRAVEKAAQRVTQLGLFDTIGWAGYTNAKELFEALQVPPNRPGRTRTLVERTTVSRSSSSTSR